MAAKLRRALITLLLPLLALVTPLITPSAAPAAGQPELRRVGGLDGLLEAVALGDGVAYVGVGPTLTVLDVRDPAGPVILVDINLGGRIRDLRRDGARLYVANQQSAELQIVDVADPLAPALLSSVKLPGNPTSVDVAGSYAYVAAYNAVLQVVDVRDPASPHLVFSSQWQAQGANSSTLDVEVADRFVYLATLGEFIIADITNPQSPQLRAVYELNRSDADIASGYGLTVIGDIAYLAVGFRGLYLFDISNPGDPRRVGIVDTPGVALDVAVDGDRAYIAERESGLTVVEMANPAAPRVLSTLDSDGTASRVQFAAGLAYVADGGGGLDIIDVQGATPLRIGGYGTAGNSNNVWVEGERAYVAGQEGLHVVDIAAPAAPRVLGSLDLGKEAYHVLADGDTLYITGYTYKATSLWAVDVSDPTAPALIGELSLPGASFRQLWKAGDALYVVNKGVEVLLVDIADPRALRHVRTIPLSEVYQIYALVVGDELGYAAVNGSELAILDLNALDGDPFLSRTRFLSSTGEPANLYSLSVLGDTAFVGLSYREPPDPWDRHDEDAPYVLDLAIVDVSDPRSPRQLGVYTLISGISEAYTIAETPGQVVLAVGTAVQLLDVGDPANPILLDQLSLHRRATSLTSASGLIFATGYQAGLQILTTAAEPIASPTQTATPSPTASPTVSPTASPTQTATPSPTVSPTEMATPSPTTSPTRQPNRLEEAQLYLPALSR